MRTFSARLTPDELKAKVERAYSQYLDHRGEEEMNHAIRNLTSTVEKDFAKVTFDIENAELLGCNTTPTGLTYLVVRGGGDWETELVYILYWDGTKLRGYVPEDGNPWNTDNHAAYGNEEELGGSDDENANKRFGVASYYDANIDMDKIKAEIERHIMYKGSNI